jgi:hypothetical protein
MLRAAPVRPGISKLNAAIWLGEDVKLLVSARVIFVAVRLVPDSVSRRTKADVEPPTSTNTRVGRAGTVPYPFFTGQAYILF